MEDTNQTLVRWTSEALIQAALHKDCLAELLMTIEAKLQIAERNFDELQQKAKSITTQ